MKVAQEKQPIIGFISFRFLALGMASARYASIRRWGDDWLADSLVFSQRSSIDSALFSFISTNDRA